MIKSILTASLLVITGSVTDFRNVFSLFMTNCQQKGTYLNCFWLTLLVEMEVFCVYKAVCLSCLITTKGQRMTDFHSLFLNVSLIFNHIKATNVDVLFKFICI